MGFEHFRIWDRSKLMNLLASEYSVVNDIEYERLKFLIKYWAGHFLWSTFCVLHVCFRNHFFINLITHTLRAGDCQFDNFVVAGGTNAVASLVHVMGLWSSTKNSHIYKKLIFVNLSTRRTGQWYISAQNFRKKQQQNIFFKKLSFTCWWALSVPNHAIKLHNVRYGLTPLGIRTFE